MNKSVDVVMWAVAYEQYNTIQIQLDNEYILDETQRKILFTEFLKTADIDGHIINITEITKGKRSKRKNKVQFTTNNSFDIVPGVVGFISKTIQMHSDDFGYIEKDEEKRQVCTYSFCVRLNISTKMDDGVIKKHDFKKAYFLYTLLASAMDIETNEDSLPDSEDELFDYLLITGYVNWIAELIKKGFFKKYQTFSENNSHFKGSIDITRHIKLNAGRNNGKIAYKYRDYTAINWFNKLLLVTYDYLKKNRKYEYILRRKINKYPEILKVISDLQYEIGATSSMTDVLRNNILSIANPYYIEAEHLRKICLRILRGEGASLFSPEISDMSDGILFYVPDLWEIYLLEYLNSENYSILYQEPYEYLEVINSKDVKVYAAEADPDFICCDDNQKPVYILDAKFRPKWNDVYLGKWSRMDLGEDFDKCLRDLLVTNSTGVGVIYPSIKGKDADFSVNEALVHHKISERSDYIFDTIPVWVPSSYDYRYPEWSSILEKSVQKSCTLVRDIVNGYKSQQTTEDK